MKKIRTLFILVSIFGITNSEAQQIAQVDILNTTTSPIQSDWITGIEIDNAGNKWIATLGGGLSKYDGTNWTTYTTSNSNIPSNNISCLEIDQQGNVWIGTRDMQALPTTGAGIAKYNGNTWTVYNTANSDILDDVINCITSDQSGNIYVGIGYNSTIHGISKFNGSSWTNYQASTLGTVAAMDVDNTNNLWVKNKTSFFKFSNNNISNAYNTGGFANDLRGTIKVDNQNNVWASGMTPSGSSTLMKYNGSEWVDMTDSSLVNSTYPVTAIAIDSHDNVWFGQAESNNNRQLTKYDGQSWDTYLYPYITSIAIEDNGDMWLGDYDFGVRHIHNCSPITIQPVDQTASLGANVSFTVGTSGQGNTFIWKVDKGAGFGFENIQNGALYSGAKTSTLTINNVQDYITDYRYKCFVDSSTLCNQTSDTVKVIIGTVGINEAHKNQPEILLYPNPVSSILSITSPIKIESIELINPLGKTYNVGYNNAKVDMTNFSTGLYFLKINNKYVYKVIRR